MSLEAGPPLSPLPSSLVWRGWPQTDGFQSKVFLSDISCGWKHIRHSLMATIDGIIEFGKCNYGDSYCYYLSQLFRTPTPMGTTRVSLSQCLEKAASS